MMSSSGKSILVQIIVGLSIVVLYGVAAYGGTNVIATLRDHEARVNRIEVRMEEASKSQAARDAEILRGLASIEKRMERIEDRLNTAVRGP
jgi:hypothetical protein